LRFSSRKSETDPFSCFQKPETGSKLQADIESTGFRFNPILRRCIMAKRTSKTDSVVSKAQAIRDYHRDNPDAGPKEIVVALTKQGVEVNAGRVSSVLRGGGNKVDVETIKAAAQFVAGYDGKLEDALAAVSSVGGFVEKCGGASRAKGALEAYEAVVAAAVK